MKEIFKWVVVLIMLGAAIANSFMSPIPMAWISWASFALVAEATGVADKVLGFVESTRRKRRYNKARY